MPPEKEALRNPAPASVTALREAAGWSIEQLAEKIHASPADVQAWEEGRRKMHPGLWALMVARSVYEMSAFEEPQPEDVRNLRASAGWTQTDFADRAGTSFRRVAGWELGEHKMKRGLWRALRVFVALENPEHVAT